MRIPKPYGNLHDHLLITLSGQYWLRLTCQDSGISNLGKPNSYKCREVRRCDGCREPYTSRLTTRVINQSDWGDQRLREVGESGSILFLTTDCE